MHSCHRFCIILAALLRSTALYFADLCSHASQVYQIRWRILKSANHWFSLRYLSLSIEVTVLICGVSQDLRFLNWNFLRSFNLQVQQGARIKPRRRPPAPPASLPRPRLVNPGPAQQIRPVQPLQVRQAALGQPRGRQPGRCQHQNQQDPRTRTSLWRLPRRRPGLPRRRPVVQRWRGRVRQRRWVFVRWGRSWQR